MRANALSVDEKILKSVRATKSASTFSAKDFSRPLLFRDGFKFLDEVFRCVFRFRMH